jgi:Ni,Fe-hydrogenase III large subunit
VLRVVLRDADGLTVLDHELADAQWQCPDLGAFFPAAGACSVRCATSWASNGTVTTSGHGCVTTLAADAFPLRRDHDARRVPRRHGAPYAFVRVEGEGVHEIPVGPVHAGSSSRATSASRSSARRCCASRSAWATRTRASRSASSRCRSRTVIASPAACRATARSRTPGPIAQAVEALARVTSAGARAALRALCLERERIANHLGDLGYLGNDGGFAFGLAQFSRLKEDVLRDNLARLRPSPADGRRPPGGITHDLVPEVARELRDHGRDARPRGLHGCARSTTSTPGCRIAFVACGIVTPEPAARLGVSGLAARASGRAQDLRRDFPSPPYDTLEVAVPTSADGDVAARVAVRFDELAVRCACATACSQRCPRARSPSNARARRPTRSDWAMSKAGAGPGARRARMHPDGTIRRCHPHDVSWHNWPALEHAVIGNIVPDFPLINKSFNLTYSGHDL